MNSLSASKLGLTALLLDEPFPPLSLNDAVVAEDQGVDPDTLGDARSWDFAEWGIGGPDEFDRLHRLAVLEHRMFRHMPVLSGVADSLWRLSDAGVWIRIITHRLCVNWGHAIAVADTVAW